jgi:uncharacterized protein
MFMVAKRELTDSLPIVIDYLESNPDFFLDNPALLSKFNLPHINGRNISSLIEYQVNHLRKNEQLYKRQIEELNEQLKFNDKLSEAAWSQAKILSDSTSIKSLYDELYKYLKQEYLCSHCLFFFFVEKRPHADYRGLRFKPIHSKLRYFFSGLYNVNKPLCDSLPSEYIDALFGDESFKIKSTVTLPIKDNNGEASGLFILGSQEYNAYRQGFSINLLNQLKDIFVKQLNTLLI